MHGAAMALMRRRIARCGYIAKTYSYPSVRRSLEQNAVRLASYVDALDAPLVHLVAHSLGGIVALNAISAVRTKIGRVVLIGTPFADCYSGRSLGRVAWGRRL